jgi:hypothetical protein
MLNRVLLLLQPESYLNGIFTSRMKENIRDEDGKMENERVA